MSDDRDPNAPDIRNLRALRPFVRRTARAVAQSQIGGKGAKVSLPRRPSKMCNVCGKGFDLVTSATEIQLKHDAPCPECDEKLQDGYTAFICDNRFAFGKSEKIADMAGKVIKVEPHVMDHMESRFTIEKKFQKPPDANDTRKE